MFRNKKNVKTVALAIAAAFLFGVAGLAVSQTTHVASAAPASSVGVVNYQMVVQQHPELAKVQTTMQAESEAAALQVQRSSVSLMNVVAADSTGRFPDQNVAEVAFSVSPEYQGKGLGKFFLKKLAAVARENGIRGLMAYTFPSNKAMIALFNPLPYKINTQFEDGDLILSCRFDEMA